MHTSSSGLYCVTTLNQLRSQLGGGGGNLQRRKALGLGASESSPAEGIVLDREEM